MSFAEAVRRKKIKIVDFYVESIRIAFSALKRLERECQPAILKKLICL